MNCQRCELLLRQVDQLEKELERERGEKVHMLKQTQEQLLEFEKREGYLRQFNETLASCLQQCQGGSVESSFISRKSEKEERLSDMFYGSPNKLLTTEKKSRIFCGSPSKSPIPRRGKSPSKSPIAMGRSPRKSPMKTTLPYQSSRSKRFTELIQTMKVKEQENYCPNYDHIEQYQQKLLRQSAIAKLMQRRLVVQNSALKEEIRRLGSELRSIAEDRDRWLEESIRREEGQSRFFDSGFGSILRVENFNQ